MGFHPPGSHYTAAAAWRAMMREDGDIMKY
jgi:hypothetical protein